MEQITQNTKITSTDINTLISELNGKLNLSGGKITGCLFLNNPDYSYLCARTTNDNSVIVCGGSNMSSGSTLRVCGIEHSSLAGSFVLTATDGTNNKQLIGRPDGTLYWNNNNVLTSAGGVMNGAIYTPGYGCISSENTTSQKSLALLGFSSKHETCASINLKSVEDSDEPGFFFINAKDDTNGNKSLVGRPNGSLTWNSKEVATDNITPSAILNMSHPTYQKLCVIKASTDNAPNNGCILSYSNTEKWVGQLFVGDNATQGIYWRGCSDGTWCNWKKIFMEDENGHLYFTNGTQLWIA